MKSRRVLFALLFVLSVVIVSGGCGGFDEPGTRYRFADLRRAWVIESGTGTAVEYRENQVFARYDLSAVPLSGTFTISEVDAGSDDDNTTSATVAGTINFLIRMTSEDGQTVEQRRDENFSGTLERLSLNKFRMVGTASGSGRLPQITITINSLTPPSAVIEESGTYTSSGNERIDIVNGVYRVK
jgi:hypothetical protein